MIEFDGYISGEAEKHFWSRERKLGIRILFASMLVFLPIMVVLTISFQSWIIFVGYCALFAIIPLLALIPKSQKEKLLVTPNHIYTEEGLIVTSVGNREEYRPISAVKLVRDYGEFYEVLFPFGQISDKFICQKNLLVKGSLEEFEALFEGKIIKVFINQDN